MIVNHPLASQDAAIVEAMRLAAAERKGVIFGPEARAAFNAGLAAGTPRSAEVRYREDVLGGVPGWWRQPADATPGTSLLYLHGGCYVVGSAEALRNFAGRFAIRTRVNTFVADYRLAPEHPFPAAIEDAVAAYQGLVDEAERVVVAGDSAGGGLTLALLAILAGRGDRTQQPHGAAAMSPWTDLALTGASLSTRAKADPVFTKAVLAISQTYICRAVIPRTPTPRRSTVRRPAARRRSESTCVTTRCCSTIPGDMASDFSRRYGQRLRDAHLNVAVHVWAGMPHVFASSVRRLRAADTAKAKTAA
jgi:acetyl esterase/lipase